MYSLLLFFCDTYLTEKSCSSFKAEGDISGLGGASEIFLMRLLSGGDSGSASIVIMGGGGGFGGDL